MTTKLLKPPMKRTDPEPTNRPPRLTFSPLAWLKLQFLCHAGPTEVAAFGLAAADDPLYLEDILVVRQRATPVTVAFDDEAVADLFDRMVDAGIPPERFARVWLHTHPGASVEPSGTDEQTFHRVFGGCDWAVMAILSRIGNTYARLTFNSGPGGSLNLPVCVDWSGLPEALPLLAGLLADWERDYCEKVNEIACGSFREFDSLLGGRGEVGSRVDGSNCEGMHPEPKRIAEMTNAEFARFEAGEAIRLSHWRDPVFGDYDPWIGDTDEGDAFDYEDFAAFE
jgi:proteasome lid subunit RPN8/RPN11